MLCAIFIFIINDNYGPKNALVISSIVLFTGNCILAISYNIEMVMLGLFLMGLGSASNARLSMNVLPEFVSDKKRQQYSVILEGAFSVGALLVGVTFYLVPDWRKVNLWFYLFPSFFIMVGFIFYFKQTPKFLIRDPKKAVEVLNQIRKINNINKE